VTQHTTAYCSAQVIEITLKETPSHEYYTQRSGIEPHFEKSGTEETLMAQGMSIAISLRSVY
jgi:hypothetical protein